VFESTRRLIGSRGGAQQNEAGARSSMHRAPGIRVYHRAMLKRGALCLLALSLSAAACSGGSGGKTGAAGASGGAGGAAGTSAGAAGMNGGAGSSGAAGAGTGTGGAGAGGSSAGAGGSSAGAGGSSAGTGGSSAGAGGSSAGAGGASDGGAGATGAGGSKSDAAAGPSFLPAGYTGTPFKALTIPGRINACDYDRGGAGVAWCHSPGNCAGGTVTGDYPQGAGVYRPPIPATSKLCSGAACDDNVGVCRMNPSKPDKINKTDLAPAMDTYLCYTQAGTWTKYTVVVDQAGTYAVGGFMAVPNGGAANISFSGPGNVTTGNVTLPVTDPVALCGGGEQYHCWQERDSLATVTFAQAGTYLMTLTQTGRFNADSFTFTKM
jgi:hypothetical protein